MLPWVLLGLSAIIGNSLLIDLIGIAVGHCYYFLEDVFPNQPGGMRCLQTPECFKKLFDSEREDPNYEQLREEYEPAPHQ